MPDRGLIGKMIGKFRVGRMLGQGGMGAVYEATDVGLQRQVAIKVMHPHLGSQTAFQQRFLQEARTAARLDHPNIVRVLSFDKIDNELIIVMELATGGNLRQYIKRLQENGQYIGYPEAIEIGIQLADALNYAHGNDMVHLDIKPDNVVLKPEAKRSGLLNYRPVLTDFGLARLTSSGEAAITEQPIGTYAYMSPEQCNAERVDSRTDVYSLGIMLFELAVGQLPYQPKTIAEAARMHGQDPLPSPTALRQDFPEALEDVLLKSLHKKPEKRYQSIIEMMEALQTLQSPRPADTLDESTPEKVAVVENTVPAIADEMSTDLVTVQMSSALADEMPDISTPAWTDQQRAHDRLIFYDRKRVVKVVSLGEPTMSIGRAYGQDIRLEGSSISRNHARIERKPNGTYYLIDLGSSNGTWIDDDKLEKDVTVILRPEQLVRLGEYWVRLELRPESYFDETVYIDPDADDEQFDTAIPSADGDTPAPDVISESEEDTHDGNTDYMGVPLPLRMPQISPPKLTKEQMEHGRLLFYSEAYQLVVVALDKDEVNIGRANDQDAQLEGLNLSYRHARVVRRDDGAYIIDLGSKNGVWVDTTRIDPQTPTKIDSSSTVRMGNYWVKYDEPRADIAFQDRESVAEFAGRQDTVAMVRPLSQAMPHYSPPPLSAEQRANDRVLFYSEDHPIQYIPLEKEAMTIGRSSEQDITLQGKRVSRNHARLEVRVDGIYVTAEQTVNGVWIEDIALVPNTPVLWQAHEIMRIGNYWVKFERGTHQFDVFAGAQYQQDNRGLIGSTIQKYRIDRFLGQGAVASVYKATDIELHRDVALRIMNPNLAAEEAMRQRFLREARSLSRLDHPNIVHVLSFDNYDGEIFMVQELIPGGNLRTQLDRLVNENRQMDYMDAVLMAIQMADGLHYAHQQGMIHRSIRPENVVLKPGEAIGPLVNYQPVLTDFGMAGLAESGEIFMTDQPDVAFPYMSPEEVQSRRIDSRSDIYELGVLLYEMTVGKPPFSPRSIAEATRMHAHEKHRSPAELRLGYPEELEVILNRALEKDPNNRFQSADEMSRALQRVTRFLSSEGSVSSFARYFSVIEDEHITEVAPDGMQKPAQMPPATRYPRQGIDSQVDRLIVYSQEFPTQTISLNRSLLTIGRDEDQDIVLPSKQISRRHARIEKTSDSLYRIIDVGSQNGSWLGDYKLIPDIAEVWESHETVRFADYWLRIELAHDIDAVVKVDDDGRDVVEEEVAPRIPTIQLPPPEHDKIGLTITESRVRVAPGSSVTLPIEVLNKGAKVDHFKVELSGLPIDWYTQPIEPIYLLPQNRETTSITLHPPMASTSSAGAHAFEVRVSTRAQGINSVAKQGALVIEPYHNFVADLEPERIRRKGLAEVKIANTGNSHGTYTVQARDRERAVRFEQAGKQYTLAPGHSDYVPIKVMPSRRHFIGRARTMPFEVTVNADKETIPPQTENGELVIYPILSIWTILGLLLLLFLCIGLAIFGVVTNNNNNRHATQTALAQVELTQTEFMNQTVLGMTATAEADSDGDGLIDAREAELGTNPDNPDTDGDGLTDGEEVFVWQTDPMRRDTDNDNLPDGMEVNELGTNPLNADTDQDDIPDNVDANPGQQPTPTITPFPTISGSQGDICPGSPIPSRLAVGMLAYITDEGVSNNFRDAPGIETGEIIGSIPNGAEIRIIGGPECDEIDQIRWWEVEFNGQEGWTAEGEGDDYYIRPPGEEDEESEEGASSPANITVADLAMPEVLDCEALGMQIQYNVSAGEWSQMLNHMGSLSFNWVKIQANWAFIQPESATDFGQNFQGLLSTIRTAKDNGHQVLVSIVKAPTWARSMQGENGPPDNPEDYANFIRVLLETAGTSIDAIELWNEPNLQREWTGTLAFSGAGYMELFRPAYRVIRDYSDDMVIVTAGLAPTGDSPTSVNDRNFLREMYRAGLDDYDDVMLGVHPFGWGNPPDSECCDNNPDQSHDEFPQFFFINTLEDYYAMSQRFRHHTTLWVTEFGWASWEGLSGSPPEPWMSYVTLEQQRDYTLQAFQIGQAIDWIGPMFLWNLNFGSHRAVTSGDEMAGYSLFVANDGGDIYARPVFDTLTSGARCASLSG